MKSGIISETLPSAATSTSSTKNLALSPEAIAELAKRTAQIEILNAQFQETKAPELRQEFRQKMKSRFLGNPIALQSQPQFISS